MTRPRSLHPPGEYVPSPAGRIWCEVEGDGDEVAVVVGGGPGVGHTHYHPWFSRLARGRRVAYYDHPGTGRSERPPEYTIELYTAALDSVCTHVGAARLVLIGVSFGGIPAVAHALARRAAVHRLVLCSAQVGATGWQAGNIDNVNRELALQFPEAWAQVLALRARGISSLADEYQALLAPLIDDLEWADPWNHPPLERDPDERFSVEAYRALIGDDPEWTVTGALGTQEPELERLTTPTLVTAGRWDRVTPPAIANAIHSRLPNAELAVFERSAHRPWAEEPEVWFGTVDRFLAPGSRHASP